jgi:hypothetical protein
LDRSIRSPRKGAGAEDDEEEEDDDEEEEDDDQPDPFTDNPMYPLTVSEPIDLNITLYQSDRRSSFISLFPSLSSLSPSLSHTLFPQMECVPRGI